MKRYLIAVTTFTILGAHLPARGEQAPFSSATHGNFPNGQRGVQNGQNGGNQNGGNPNGGQGGNVGVMNQNQPGGGGGGGGYGGGGGGGGGYQSKLKDFPIGKAPDAKETEKAMAEGPKALATQLTKGTETLFSQIKELNASIKDVDVSKFAAQVDGTLYDQNAKTEAARAKAETDFAIEMKKDTLVSAIKTVYSVNTKGDGLTPHQTTVPAANGKKIFDVTSTQTASVDRTPAAAGKTPGVSTPSPIAETARAFSGGYNAPQKVNRLLK